jgi:hypothetical protein
MKVCVMMHSQNGSEMLMSWVDVSDMDVMDVMLTWTKGGTVRKGSLSHLAGSIRPSNTCIAAGWCC